MKKETKSKLLTAKQARKRSESNFNIILTKGDLYKLLFKYVELGFTNMVIDIDDSIEYELQVSLLKKGYKVYQTPQYGYATLEIEW